MYLIHNTLNKYKSDMATIYYLSMLTFYQANCETILVDYMKHKLYLILIKVESCKKQHTIITDVTYNYKPLTRNVDVV